MDEVALRRLRGDPGTVFAHGSLPEGLDGRFAGKLVRTTLGPGLDAMAEELARLWMPWLGKAFVGGGGWGINIFDRSARTITEFAFPGYRMLRADGPERFAAFRFRTHAGPSATDPSVQVLRIDYDLPENPSWPIRRLLDELIEVEPGRYLGQALLRLRGRWRRAAWFALEG